MAYYQIHKHAKRWLPYTIGIVGISLSILLWYIALQPHSSSTFVILLEIAFPWIILTLGVLISTLLAIATRYGQLSKQRTESLNLINYEFQKEIEGRLHAEESKQKLEKELLQNQKLQAIGTLAGGIAHDFNNILYAIIGYTEMARDDIPKESLSYKNLGKVLKASQRGCELVSRILAFGRHHHHEFKLISLHDTIEGILCLLEPTIPASVSIEFDSPPEPCSILGNQTQLHQVIVNIINNAVDAMGGEGIVNIQLSHIPDEHYYKIEITDTGYGMDQSVVERIFEPFFTTKEVGKGTGLGLSTVHAIMEEHQGEVSVKSQLGHGTTFTLLLPEG